MSDKWNGEDRRIHNHGDPIIICKQEDKINEMSEGIVRVEGTISKLDMRINGSMDKIARHMQEGDWYRKLVIGTAISLALSIFGGIITTLTVSSSIAYQVGQYAKEITVNTSKIENIENYIHGTKAAK